MHEFDSIIAGMYVMPNGMIFVSTDDDSWLYVSGYRIKDPERSLSALERGQQGQLSLSGAPNPFNYSTTISFTLYSDDLPCTLRLYTVSGQTVRSLIASSLNRGQHTVLWDGKDADGRA